MLTDCAVFEQLGVDAGVDQRRVQVPQIGQQMPDGAGHEVAVLMVFRHAGDANAVRVIDDEAPHAADHFLNPAPQNRLRGEIEVAEEREHGAGRADEIDVVVVRVVRRQLVGGGAERFDLARIVETGQKLVEQFGLAVRGKHEVVFDRVGDAAEQIAQPHRRFEARGQELDAQCERPRDQREHQARLAIDVRDRGVLQH
jgi:hypothetical protein